MKSKKASRLDHVERALGEVIKVLEKQGLMLNFLMGEINTLKAKDVEVKDPNQLEFPFPKEEGND